MGDSGLLISALIAMVAVVGLVVLLKGGATGGVMVIQGDSGQGSFDRPLGTSGESILGAKQTCWYTDEGEIRCPQYEQAPTGSFGPPPEYREGGRPTEWETSSGRGFFAG
ncbi:MAG: hypothetical protein ACE5FT_04290 [Candidatus Nanoarchaeia archaeon]